MLLLLGELRRLEMPYYLNMYTKESQWELPTEVAEEGVSNGPSQVQAAHLLVKHKDSRRASSWREENITRTKDEAHDILSGYLEKVSIFIFTGEYLFANGMAAFLLTFSRHEHSINLFLHYLDKIR